MDRDEFERCWHANVHGVMTYAQRHVGPDAAADITSATFLTAWRVWPEVPGHARAWLLSAARGHIRNHQRGRRRARSLRRRLELLDLTATPTPDAALTFEQRSVALAALVSLPINQREALLLVAWDGLDTNDAARVLGCSPQALRTRLSRARAALDTALPTSAQRDFR